MKRFLNWLLNLFRKNKKVVQVEVVAPIVYPKKIIKVTSGKRHVWVETRHGKIRKPIGEVK